MTLNQAFEILKKSASARDAKIVLCNIAGDDEHLSWAKVFRVYRAARRLSRGVPVAKIIKKKWFYGFEFITEMGTLDPRPDSETLVEYAIGWVAGRPGVKVLDLGTGTGCLLCSVLKNIPDASGVGIDISGKARRIAKKNVQSLELQNKVKINAGSFAKLSRKKYPDGFDLIISNPPYIAKKDPRVDGGAIWDPKCALYSGRDGLMSYRQIAKSAKGLLRNDGVIILEIGAGQGDQVRKIFESSGWKFVESKPDLSGIVRVLVFKV